MTITTIVNAHADGGAAFCAVCGGSLVYSWVVTFSDNHSENRCSLHLDSP